MAISITNRTKQLLIMDLNNGESLYLAPSRPSGPIAEAQVDGNEKFEKLLRNNSITAIEVEVDQPKSKKAKADKELER